MSKHEKVSTGSVRGKKILRTSSFRGSVRETISRALKSTLGLNATPSRESSVNTSSLPRSSSSSDSTASLQQSSGFCSMSHLPPPSRKPQQSLMSMSMYEPRSCPCSHGFCSFSQLTCSPSVHTLKNLDYDDCDDTISLVSTASTSRFVTCNPKRVKKHNLHPFLNSPVRLRRRDGPTHDEISSGFEPAAERPRCHSTQGLNQQYVSSEFSPADFVPVRPIEKRIPHNHSDFDVTRRSSASVRAIAPMQYDGEIRRVPPSSYSCEFTPSMSQPTLPTTPTSSHRKAAPVTPHYRVSVVGDIQTPKSRSSHSKRFPSDLGYSTPIQKQNRSNVIKQKLSTGRGYSGGDIGVFFVV